MMIPRMFFWATTILVLCMAVVTVVGAPPGTTTSAATGIIPTREYTKEQRQGVPLIDLANPDMEALTQEISNACSSYGFFQVINHGIPQDLLTRFQEQCRQYFHLPMPTKQQWKRTEDNARGFFDDEFTKQRRDWKECLDAGVPGSRNWDVDDSDESNACLDGLNRFPPPETLPDFRKTFVEYFEACAELSHRLTILFAKGLGLPEDHPLVTDLQQQHTSYLRVNFYPPYHQQQSTNPEDSSSASLGISPHNDAGFLTVLLQDDGCHSLQAWHDEEGWIPVHPIPGALTINTGHMAQVFSNDRYIAPLHRVMTDRQKERFSAPFFYNPGYQSMIAPVVEIDTSQYQPINWGYFRAVRFAGDFTDLGMEIQIGDFANDSRTGKPLSSHLDRQQVFLDNKWYSMPFGVRQYRQLLEEHPDPR